MKNKTLLNVLLCGMLSCAFVNSSVADPYGRKIHKQKNPTKEQRDAIRKNTVTAKESKQAEEKQFVDVYEFCRTATKSDIDDMVRKSKKYLNDDKQGDIHKYIYDVALRHLREDFQADKYSLVELFDLIAWTEEYAFDDSPKEFSSKNVDFDT